MQMGANATISWSKVSSKPNDLAYLDDIPDDEYITEITENTIKTTNVYAKYLEVESANIIGNITADSLSVNASIDVNTNATIGSKLYMDATNFNDGKIGRASCRERV